MKRNCCSKCHQEIERQDFFMQSRSGKICSDCLVKAETVEAESAHLFKQRGPKGEKPPAAKKSGMVIAMPLKEAL